MLRSQSLCAAAPNTSRCKSFVRAEPTTVAWPPRAQSPAHADLDSAMTVFL